MKPRHRSKRSRASFLFVAAVLLASTGAGAAVLSLPDNASGGPTTLVEVPIALTPGDGMLGIDMTITYSTSVLQAQNVTVSGIAAAQGFALVRNLNTPGVIIISEYAMQDALVGSGEIAKIQFLVTGPPGATSPLTFTSASINEGGIPVAPDPGLFTVTCAGAANGTACNDGNACTVGDACQGGVCAGTTVQAPGEIVNVRIAADRATITWDPAAGATGYDALRGLVGQLPVGSGAGESCLAPGVSVATASDPATPPIMTSYWYLVRGRNACGTGTYGFRAVGGAPGAERTSTSCP
jgi:hypothetical protein